MIVDKVRNATTKESAIHYEVMLRIWPSDLERETSTRDLYKTIVRAINGIAYYPILEHENSSCYE